MALPRDTDPYDSYTDQLVYFSARLAANPDTAPLAEAVEMLLTDIDAGNEKLRLARRDEIRARARRDHQDGIGDAKVRRFKRHVDVIGDSYITSRLFPSGIGHTVAPRGRPQLDRLAKLAQAIEEFAASPRAAAHAEADEIKEILDKGKITVAEVTDTLTPIIDAWEEETLEVARAADAFSFVRSDGIGRLGAVLGELRAKLGGNSKAAYAYTQQGRTSEGVEVEDVDEGENEGGVSEAD
jgi:hypothetical protein